MVTRIIFFIIALSFVAAGFWAYRHDEKLQQHAALVSLGDPNEGVRELMGDPSSEGECGSRTPAPAACTDEYVYRYYYSIFRPQYEIIWFDHSGKVIGQQHFQRP